jgi:hypothetical protein
MGKVFWRQLRSLLSTTFASAGGTGCVVDCLKIFKIRQGGADYSRSAASRLTAPQHAVIGSPPNIVQSDLVTERKSQLVEGCCFIPDLPNWISLLQAPHPATSCGLCPDSAAEHEVDDDPFPFSIAFLSRGWGFSLITTALLSSVTSVSRLPFQKMHV